METITLHGRCADCTRDGVDTRSKDLTGACTDKQELACDSCGAMNDLTEFEGSNKKVYYACNLCWFNIQDSREELETEDHECLCEDCGMRAATETFNHLDGRSFQLCSDCFGEADHEDSYGADFGSVPRLRVAGRSYLCECRHPEINEDDRVRCIECSGIVVSKQNLMYCECPVPCDFLSPTHCELCNGTVVLPTQEPVLQFV